MKKIVYVGTKELKYDNIAQTGLAWTRGEIHEIEDEKALKLLDHPLIWADADKDYTLLPELKAVEPTPRVSFIPTDATSPYWEPVVIPVTNDVFAQLRDKHMIAVFMTEADADMFQGWKSDQADQSPKDLSKMDKRSREYKLLMVKQGLKSKAA